MNTSTTTDEDVRQKVRDGYGKIAKREQESCCSTSSCGGSSVSAKSPSKHAEGIGYSQQELAGVPDGANMGLSCGNPTAIASLQPGEVVLDLGSGGGFDVFIAGEKVGTSGRAIGVDMTPEMVTKARRNAAAYEKRTGLKNVEFRFGEIEHLPVADNSVDVVISNCVINLSPDKPQVWREIHRVLKLGGRVAVSDLALLKPLPDSIRQSVEALVGCIAGASLIAEIETMVKQAGFVDVVLAPQKEYVDAMTSGNDALYAEVVKNAPANSKASEVITSLSISARKQGN